MSRFINDKHVVVSYSDQMSCAETIPNVRLFPLAAVSVSILLVAT